MKTLPISNERISIQLARNKMERKDLCKQTGITEANFSMILKRGTCRPITAGKIAEALGVDVTEIMP